MTGDNGGLSEVSVDNRRGVADVFIKLVAHPDYQPKPVRHVIVKVGESFTLQNVEHGRYELRYQNLDSGETFKSEPFELEERPFATEQQYTRMEVTLYKVPNGNMHVTQIPSGDFDLGEK